MTALSYLLLTGSGSAPQGEVDPASYATAELRAVRGALFTIGARVSGEPRPNSHDNVCTTGGLQTRSREEAGHILSEYRSRRYTHGPSGPWIDPGYHGLDPAVDFRTDNGDAVADMLQRMWDGRVIPVCFIVPDNWTLDQARADLEPILRQPRFQRLCRMVCKGFEPSADTPNSEWVAWVQWLADVFPNALRYIHMVANMDAPGNNDDFTPGQPKYIGLAESWRRVAPYLHGFLGQYGPFGYDPRRPVNADQVTQVNEWRKLWREQRFKKGIAGWPTSSAWGAGQPMDHIAAEYCSFTRYWPQSNEPDARGSITEDAAQAWGDIALHEGTDGVLDGCH